MLIDPGKFTELQNIGKTLAHKLNLIGVKSEHDLKLLRSENQIIKIATIDSIYLDTFCDYRVRKVYSGLNLNYEYFRLIEGIGVSHINLGGLIPLYFLCEDISV